MNDNGSYNNYYTDSVMTTLSGDNTELVDQGADEHFSLYLHWY